MATTAFEVLPQWGENRGKTPYDPERGKTSPEDFVGIATLAEVGGFATENGKTSVPVPATDPEDENGCATDRLAPRTREPGGLIEERVTWG